MDFLRMLFHRLFDPVKIAGYVIVSTEGSALVWQNGRTTGWGGRFPIGSGPPGQLFFHPAWALAGVIKLTASWKRRPATAYPAILERRTGAVRVTGGPFDFWEMATWHLPPGSPIGKAPGQRSRDYFSPGQAVWYLRDQTLKVWGEGIVVSVSSEGYVFVSHDGTVSKCYYTQDVVWPRDPSE